MELECTYHKFTLLKCTIQWFFFPVYPQMVQSCLSSLGAPISESRTFSSHPTRRKASPLPSAGSPESSLLSTSGKCWCFYIVTNTCCLSGFFLTAVLVATKWFLIVVLTCFSLMTISFEHLFMSLWVIYTSLEKRLYKSFVFFNWVARLLLRYKSSLYILETRSDICFANIFSQIFSVRFQFTFLMLSFESQVLDFDKVQLT